MWLLFHWHICSVAIHYIKCCNVRSCYCLLCLWRSNCNIYSILHTRMLWLYNPSSAFFHLALYYFSLSLPCSLCVLRATLWLVLKIYMAGSVAARPLHFTAPIRSLFIIIMNDSCLPPDPWATEWASERAARLAAAVEVVSCMLLRRPPSVTSLSRWAYIALCSIIWEISHLAPHYLYYYMSLVYVRKQHAHNPTDNKNIMFQQAE